MKFLTAVAVTLITAASAGPAPAPAPAPAPEPYVRHVEKHNLPAENKYHAWWSSHENAGGVKAKYDIYDILSHVKQFRGGARIEHDGDDAPAGGAKGKYDIYEEGGAKVKYDAYDRPAGGAKVKYDVYESQAGGAKVKYDIYDASSGIAGWPQESTIVVVIVNE